MNGILHIEQHQEIIGLPTAEHIIVAPYVHLHWQLIATDENFDRLLHIELQEGAQLTHSIQLQQCTGSLAIQYHPSCQSEITLQGRITLSGIQQLHFTTLQYHVIPQAKSYTQVQAVLADAARLYYTAQVIIERQAYATHAEQKNKNLLLSPQAFVQAYPCLEVATDQVTCSHGSATEYLDELQLYTLMSRGIGQMQAENLIVEAFLKV